MAGSNQDRFRTTFQEAPVGIAHLAPDGTYLRVNRRYSEILGYPVDELLGRSFEEVTHPEDRDADLAQKEKMLASEADTYSVEKRYVRKDGSVVWAALTAVLVRDDDGAPDYFIVAIRNITKRKRAQQRLAHSEARWRALFDGSRQAILLIDRDRRVKAYNALADEWAERVLGHGFTEGDDVAEQFGAFPESTFEASFEAALAGEVPTAVREIPLPGGGTRWFEVSYAPVTTEDGEVIGVSLTALDVTERKEVQHALEAEKHFAESMLESMPGILYLFDEDGSIVRWNTAFQKASGYSAEEIRGMHPLDLIVPEERERVGRSIREVFETGAATTEATLIGKTGETARHFFTGRRLEIDGRPYLVGVGIDISARIEMEEELRRQKETLQLVLDNIPVMIAFFDPEGRFLMVNRAWEETLGWSFEEVEGRNDLMAEFYPDPEDREKVLEFMRSAEAGWRELQTTVRDGTKIDTVWANVRLPDGTSIGIGEDISELKETREQLFQIQKMEAVGRLAGGIAHDFNNLLVPIMGYTELTLSDLGDDSPLADNLMEVQKAAARAMDLTQQILAFSRKQALNVRPLDMNRVIREFEPMARRLIGEDIETRTELAEDLDPVQADKGQMEQVLLNLIVNARDAMPGGGTLTIETRNKELDAGDAARTDDLAPGRYVTIAVRDTGHGMDAETAEQIFEPFYTTKAEGQGTGLGLATVYGIVKQHGGEIRVDSEPAQGTTFEIDLPGGDAARGETGPAPPAADAAGGGGETILVAEDERPVRQLVCKALSLGGYQVLEATTPPQAVEIAAEHDGPIDLLVTDVVMGEMNGRELYDAVLEHRPDLQVLYMSGYSDGVISSKGVLDEDVDFLPKPFAVDELTRTVREILDQPSEG